MVVSSNQVFPSPRKVEAPRTEDELNPTPVEQVDPNHETKINLGPSLSSARGENRDAPLGASHEDFKPTTAD